MGKLYKNEFFALVGQNIIYLQSINYFIQMSKTHQYFIDLKWTGNRAVGTQSYASYERSYQIQIANKPVLEGSADPAFRGDETKYNPEEFLVMALSSCHMLWYLHLCAAEGIVVVDYHDLAEGTLIEEKGGEGQFAEVVLKPTVIITSSDSVQKAQQLHAEASQKCFIANSVNFPIKHQPQVLVGVSKDKKATY